MKRAFVITLGCLLAFCSLASATTWYIKDDGTGDVPTIQAGIDAASAPDTVLLADGLYTGEGNRDIHVWGKEITILSESGDPYGCVIDCGGSSSSWHAGFVLDAGETPSTVLKGVSIQGAYNAGGSAIFCNETSPTITDCVFYANSTDGVGGAMDLTNSSPTITNCVFTTNYSPSYGGAVSCSYSTPEFVYCAFISNTSDYGGGAVYAHGGAPEFNACYFIANRSLWAGGVDCQEGCSAVLTACSFFMNVATYSAGGLRASNSSPTISNCTFVADSCGYGAAGVLSASLASPTLYATVIAFGEVGAGFACEAPLGSHSLTCCIIYGNAGGDWVDCISGLDGTDGNLYQDPLFCDLAGFSPNFENCSPCVAENNTCGVRIGSGVAGCGCGEATEPTTWGNIKAMYR